MGINIDILKINDFRHSYILCSTVGSLMHITFHVFPLYYTAYDLYDQQETKYLEDKLVKWSAVVFLYRKVSELSTGSDNDTHAADVYITLFEHIIRKPLTTVFPLYAPDVCSPAFQTYKTINRECPPLQIRSFIISLTKLWFNCNPLYVRMHLTRKALLKWHVLAVI